MEVFLARQPIFDKKKNVYAYELLFRAGIQNFYTPNVDGDYATSNVISNSFFIIGIDKVTQGKPAFINFTKNLILSDAPSSMPKDLVVVEILETVEPEENIINA
ncbi:MAG: hypothetical protein HQK78_00545, partial [Desulfobacterales bacterium]|nr:hypothetical protein [Desulfobacterales bacterium]